jgi:DNA modification methylase
VIDLRHGDCREVLRSLPSASVDAIITDPPYPEITREYGRWTEAEWHDLMRAVVGECRRVLKPHGSAVFILQPNSERVGRMRPWLWDFLAWACREWNMVQDAWWWNTSTLPVGGANRLGLLRPSLKIAAWLGAPECYRDQDAVLLDESAANFRDRTKRDFDRDPCPSRIRSMTEGPRDNYQRLRTACVARGGTTPFNVIVAGSDGRWNGGTDGHPASTPLKIMDWWVRYICPEGGMACDPFMGSGTCGLAALGRNRSFLGIESFPKYFAIAERRIHAALAETPLFA